MLPRAERARLHGVAAGWLDERAGGREDALAELVAFHYREAATWRARAADAEARARRLAGARRRVGVQRRRHHRGARPPARGHRVGRTCPPARSVRAPRGATQSGSAADAPLRTALRLSEEQGRPAEDQLRILGRVLMFATRAQGSVATRMSDEAMAALRARGRALLAHAIPGPRGSALPCRRQLLSVLDERRATRQSTQASRTTPNARSRSPTVSATPTW